MPSVTTSRPSAASRAAPLLGPERLARVPVRDVGWVILLAVVVMVVAGNGARIWWSGAVPAVLGSALVIVVGNCRPEGFQIRRAHSPVLLTLVGNAMIASISTLAAPAGQASALLLLSAYIAPVVLYLAVQDSVATEAHGVSLLVVTAAATCLPLGAGLVAYYQIWGIPSGIEFLMARYDNVRMAPYMAATFGNTSNTAAYLALFLPMVLSALLLRGLSFAARAVFALATLSCVLTMLVVQSRTAFFLLLPAGFLVAWYHGVRWWAAAGVAAGLLAMLIIPALAVLDRLFELTLGAVIDASADQSVSERLEAMTAGWRLFVDNPGLGIGPGASLHLNPYTSAHQFWIQQAAELGLVGGLLAIATLVATLAAFARVLRAGRSRDELRFTLLVGPATFVVYCAVANAPLAQNVVNPWIGGFALLVAGSAALPSRSNISRPADVNGVLT